ncbi:MAG: hypothetical protein MJ074_01820 [Oscillospiraceae bacterium]|nr:hypothetical protein [Oscillospiraceae bacterium]
MRNVLEDPEIRESFYETDEESLLGERGETLLSELSDADHETLRKIFIEETGSDVRATKAEKDLYAYAVRIAGLAERKKVKAAGRWYIIEEVKPEAYTANMIRSSNATKAMGADVVYYLGQMKKPNGELVYGLTFPGDNKAIIQADARSEKDIVIGPLKGLKDGPSKKLAKYTQKTAPVKKQIKQPQLRTCISYTHQCSFPTVILERNTELLNSPLKPFRKKGL